jgi:hypothetical protein
MDDEVDGASEGLCHRPIETRGKSLKGGSLSADKIGGA